MEKFCPKCGKKVSATAKFCPHCGYNSIINFSGTALLKFGSKLYEDTFSKNQEYDERPIFFVLL